MSAPYGSATTSRTNRGDRRVPVGVEVEAMSDEGLTEWVITADLAARFNAWSRLVAVLGRDKASRRWLKVFAAFDAAET